MGKSKKKKKVSGLSPEVKDALSKAAEDIIAALPSDDPAGLFASKVDALGGYSAELIAELAGHRKSEVLNYFLKLELTLTDKASVKAVKKAVYSLEQAGIQGDESLKDNGESILKGPASKEPLAWLSQYNLAGFRFGALAVPGLTSRYDACLVMMDYIKGLVEFTAWNVSLSELKRTIRGLSEKTFAATFEVPPANFKYALTEAAARAKASKRREPEGYSDFMYRARTVPTADRPIIYDMLPDDFDPSNIDLDEAAVRLLDLPMLVNWHLVEELEPYLRKINDAQTGVLVLTEAQKEEQRLAVIEDAKVALFTDHMRKAFRERLEETAAIFWLDGEKDPAYDAVATARDLEREPTPVNLQPFIRRFVDRSFEFTFELFADYAESGQDREPETDPESGLILP